MQNNVYQGINTQNPQENVIAGAVGAFLFSLAGGVVWFLLWQIGILAGISGVIGVVCAIKGYKVFGKAESKKGVIISVVIAVIVIVIAWYACLSLDVMHAYEQWYADGEVDYLPSYFECVGHAYLYLQDGEILRGYLIDLLIGLAFCAFGSFGSIRSAFRRVDQNNYNAAANSVAGTDFGALYQTPDHMNLSAPDGFRPSIGSEEQEGDHFGEGSDETSGEDRPDANGQE